MHQVEEYDIANDKITLTYKMFNFNDTFQPTSIFEQQRIQDIMLKQSEANIAIPQTINSLPPLKYFKFLCQFVQSTKTKEFVETLGYIKDLEDLLEPSSLLNRSNIFHHFIHRMLFIEHFVELIQDSTKLMIIEDLEQQSPIDKCINSEDTNALNYIIDLILKK